MTVIPLRITPGDRANLKYTYPGYANIGVSGSPTTPSSPTAWMLQGRYTGNTFTQSSPGAFTFADSGDGMPFAYDFPGAPGTNSIILATSISLSGLLDVWRGSFQSSNVQTMHLGSNYYFFVFNTANSDLDANIATGPNPLALTTVTDFVVSTSTPTINAGDAISVTVALDFALPIGYSTRFFVTTVLPPAFVYGGSAQFTPLGGSAFVQMDHTAASKTFTFPSSLLGNVAIGGTTRLYIVPADNGFIYGGQLILDTYHTVDITIKQVTPPPPPSNPGGPVNAYRFSMTGSIAVSIGGGSNKLYALIARSYQQVNSSPLKSNTTALRFVQSLDFGETFQAGVDVSPHDQTNVAFIDGAAGLIIPNNANGNLILITMPSGALYANGSYFVAGSGNNYWKSARLSVDGGRTWSATSQDNAATVTGPSNGAGTSYWSGRPGVFWTTSGAYEGAKGSGGQGGGAYRVLKIVNCTAGGHQGVAETADDGNTWTMPTDMPNSPVYIGRWPIVQPVTWRGGLTDGISFSEDDYHNAVYYHPLIIDQFNQYSSGRGIDNGRVVLSTDTDVLYLIYTASLSGQQQLVLWVFREAPNKSFGLQGESFLPGFYSSSKDGSNLLPIIVPDTNALIIWQWKGRMVLLMQDANNLSRLQGYASNNGGQWWYKTAYSDDAGTTWTKS